MTDLDLLRRHSRWTARLILGLLVVTAVMVVIPAMFSLDRSPFRLLFIWGPALFYLYALWAIRAAFADFARGGVFGPAIATGCIRAGVALAIGAGLSAVGVPIIMRTLADFALAGVPPGAYRSVMRFDLAYLAVGVVGIALVLLGRLLRRAAEIQAEAAALRDELSEFF